MWFNVSTFEDQKAKGVNGIQVLDDALGVLKLLNNNINSSNKSETNSMEQYKFIIELIIPETNQFVNIEFSFCNYSKFNDLAQLINTNYLDGQNYKIIFYKLKDNIWSNGSIDYNDLQQNLKDETKCDFVGEATIKLNNFTSKLNFLDMKNLTSENIKTNINWNEQWEGGIKSNK